MSQVTHYRRCESTGNAIVNLSCADSGDAYDVRIPWEHRNHPIGWGKTPRLRWQSDGKPRRGIVLARGPEGVTTVDTDGVEHLVPHDAYEDDDDEDF